MNCLTHHPACECREHNFSVMTKAMLDVTMELDCLKSIATISKEEKERLGALVERAYVSIEVCQFNGGEISHEFAARIACCSEVAAGPGWNAIDYFKCEPRS